MALKVLPFLTGPAPSRQTAAGFAPRQPTGNLASVSPLSKAQLALWFDYLQRPDSSHYLLTLRVDLSQHALTLDKLIQVIQTLGTRHPMLRTTFHVDSDTDDIAKSFMAVHDESSVQEVEIVMDDLKLHEALRRPFQLSSQFPLRWVIHMKVSSGGGVIQQSYTVFAAGHHIAVDGTSMSVLSSELLEELESGEGNKHPNHPLRLEYGEYIQRQEGFLRSPAGLAASEFWRSQLQHTRPFQWTVAKPKESHTLNYRQLDTWNFFPNAEIKEWGNLYKTSWFRVATSIVGLATTAMAKPQPHHDHALMVAFGARPREFDQCVSHMANTMPVKFPLTSLLRAGASFSDAVKAMGRSISTAKKHEMFPFMSLMEEAKRTMEPNQLDFKVAVTFSPKLANKTCELYPVEGIWDLFFCFLEQDDGVSLGVISNPLVFSQGALKELQNMFNEIFALSKSQPTFKLTELGFLQNRAPAQLIQGPTSDDVEKISSSRVHQLIKARAAIQPDLVALSSAEKCIQMTYGELAAQSSQVAHFLQRSGVGKNDAVLVHLERGFEQVVWILGVLESGAFYIVLDKTWPAARKTAIGRVAKAKLTITDTETMDFTVSTEGKAAATVLLSKCGAEVASMPSTPLECSISDSDLAYVVFTSGSTGQPKGVMVEHSNLSHYVSSTRSMVKVGPHSRVLQLASFAFDAVILEYAVTLSYGGTLCFADHPQVLVGDYLADIIDSNEINFFHCTPSVLSTIPADRLVPSLRMVSVGGEASPPGLLDHWRKRVELLHAYGPTETTVIVTIEGLPQDDSAGQTPVDATVIGSALANSELLICGEGSLEPLPTKEMGEICIAGPQVTRGYMEQDELTRAKFHSVTLKDGRLTRLYRSGDKGFLDENGKLHIRGRIGNREIKVRGYRVDLQEIEKNIMSIDPDVTMVSIQLLGDSLVGLLVPATVDGERVRSRLLEDTPRYAVPTRFLAIPSLPLNMNGKIDHAQAGSLAAKLFAQETVPSVTGSPGHARDSGSAAVARTPAETVHLGVSGEERRRERLRRHLTVEVSQLWSQLLGPSRQFDSEAGFFDVGGHSLLLTKLHRLIKERFSTGSRPSLLDIFSMSSIRKQVDCLMDLVDMDAMLTSEIPSRDTDTPSIGSADHTDMSASITLESSVSSMPSTVGVDQNQRYAIVGMSCRSPGAANPEQLWNVVMQQGDAVTTFPAPQDLPFTLAEHSAFIPRYGVIKAHEGFKASAYSMSEAEAEAMDPQKRVFLDVASEALTDAGIPATPESTVNPVGVFVGAAPNTFLSSHDNPGNKSRDPTPQCFANHYQHLLDCPIATFTSYKLNITGPNVSLNTACSSALTALQLACTSLSQGDCDAALVGGVSIAFPQEGGYISATGGDSYSVFSPTGFCHPLDSRADGCVPADGVAAVVVKRLSDARAANDRVYAVIEGIAIGSDGAVDKAGLGVPSSSGQSRTVEAAVRKAGPKALEHLRYVEMHGSGTPWGDALEVQGLKLALERLDKTLRSTKGPQTAGDRLLASAATKIYLGSNKGNFGNVEAASGLLSLIKASLSLSLGIVPPLPSLQEPSPLCEFGESRFEPLGKQMTLEPEDRVGVTSLGYGGSNAHVVLGAAPLFGLEKKSFS